MGNNYTSDIGNTNNTSTTVGVIMVPNTGTDTGFGTWTGNTPSVTPFATYNNSIENAVSALNNNLNLYATTVSAQSVVNQFGVSSDGTIAVVPEPSTYALCGVGALLLFVAYRRKLSA
jgi:hypothetical protein